MTIDIFFCCLLQLIRFPFPHIYNEYRVIFPVQILFYVCSRNGNKIKRVNNITLSGINANLHIRTRELVHPDLPFIYFNSIGTNSLAQFKCSGEKNPQSHLIMSRTNIVTSKILREQRNEFPQEFIPGYLLRVMKDHTRVYGDIPLFVSRIKYIYIFNLIPIPIYSDLTIFFYPLKTDWNTGDTLTVTQLISECHLIAAEFRRRGIRRGEFVCCLVYSNVHYYSFALASWLCGCIVTCLQHGFSQGTFFH